MAQRSWDTVPQAHRNSGLATNLWSSLPKESEALRCGSEQTASWEHRHTVEPNKCTWKPATNLKGQSKVTAVRQPDKVTTTFS